MLDNFARSTSLFQWWLAWVENQTAPVSALFEVSIVNYWFPTTYNSAQILYCNYNSNSLKKKVQTFRTNKIVICHFKAFICKIVASGLYVLVAHFFNHAIYTDTHMHGLETYLYKNTRDKSWTHTE